MLRELEEITSALVRGYNPERVILFGSHGTAAQVTGSDIDLLIIKESSARPIDRRAEVDRLLTPRAVPIDVWVYTPAEVRALFSAGSPMIEEIMETGRLLYMRKVTSSWLRDAEEELAAAELLLRHGTFRPSCYHSQQYVEKVLKTLVLEKGRRPSRTHDLVALALEAKEVGREVQVDTDDLVFLNSVYRARYPAEEGLLPRGEPAKEDAEKALRIARSVSEQQAVLFS